MMRLLLVVLSGAPSILPLARIAQGKFRGVTGS